MCSTEPIIAPWSSCPSSYKRVALSSSPPIVSEPDSSVAPEGQLPKAAYIFFHCWLITFNLISPMTLQRKGTEINKRCCLKVEKVCQTNNDKSSGSLYKASEKTSGFVEFAKNFSIDLILILYKTLFTSHLTLQDFSVYNRNVYSYLWDVHYGAVSKISAFRPQVPQCDHRFCRDLNICATSFPPKLTQLSILQG